MTQDIVAFYGCIVFFLVYCGLIIEGVLTLPTDSVVSFKRKVESGLHQLLFLACFLYTVHACWWDTFRNINVFKICLGIMTFNALRIMSITFNNMMKIPL